MVAYRYYWVCLISTLMVYTSIRLIPSFSPSSTGDKVDRPVGGADDSGD